MSLKKRLENILEKVEKSAIRSGRKASDITLIAVSKEASIQQILEAYDLGLRHFGENRLQKALPKQALLPKDIIWHFIGPIQGNKAASIAQAFPLIHSVGSCKMANRIGLQASQSSCFMQLNLSEENSKEGFSLAEFLENQQALHAIEGLHIQGLMTMGPHTEDKEKIRSCFRQLASLQRKFPGLYSSLSMGMSQDFTIAIEEGSTHIRIGRELFSGLCT
jgi:pyridoxal phosphate enzyme (YggS family)